jgi:hypothetical protein
MPDFRDYFIYDFFALHLHQRYVVSISRAIVGIGEKCCAKNCKPATPTNANNELYGNDTFSRSAFDFSLSSFSTFEQNKRDITAPKAMVNPIKYNMTISMLLPPRQLANIPIKEMIEKTTFNPQRAVVSDLTFLLGFMALSINHFKIYKC